MLRPGRPRSTTAVYFALFCSCFIIYFAAKKRFPLFAKNDLLAYNLSNISIMNGVKSF